MRSIQDADVKQLSDVASASQLINDTKIYDTTNLQQLSATISSLSPSIYDAGNSGATPNINFANGSTQKITANAAAVTFSFSNPVTGQLYLIKILQDATGSRTYAWPGSVKWSGATVPVGSGANKVDLISFFYDGTNFFGTYTLNF